jgi:large subunit ribosomal protein L13
MLKQNSTTFINKQEAEKNRSWFLFDAKGKTLGRFASEIAKIIMGKHRVDYTPNSDTGDGVVIINADQVVLTGEKEAQKFYRYYTGHIGGQRDVPYRAMKQKNPTFILRHAIMGMLPANKRTDAQLKRLRIFVGEQHDMQAQKPQAITL